MFRHCILRTKETKLICFFIDCTDSNEERIEDDDAVVFDLGSKPVEAVKGLKGQFFGMGTV